VTIPATNAVTCSDAFSARSGYGDSPGHTSFWPVIRQRNGADDTATCWCLPRS